jgi:hypothetical protein
MDNKAREPKEADLKSFSKTDYLKQMLGDTVLVTSNEEGDWHGEVSSVIDEETVVVMDSQGDPRIVDIFKLRSI